MLKQPGWKLTQIRPQTIARIGTIFCSKHLTIDRFSLRCKLSTWDIVGGTVSSSGIIIHHHVGQKLLLTTYHKSTDDLITFVGLFKVLSGNRLYLFYPLMFSSRNPVFVTDLHVYTISKWRDWVDLKIKGIINTLGQLLKHRGYAPRHATISENDQ